MNKWNVQQKIKEEIYEEEDITKREKGEGKKKKIKN